MKAYLLWRLLLIVPTALLASITIFVVMRALPGDVAIVILSGGGETPHSVEAREAFRTQLGLDQPLLTQYGRWLTSMTGGEFGGKSLFTHQPIRSTIARQLPITLLLTTYIVLLSFAVAVPLGILSAVHRARWPDRLIRLLTLTGGAIPSFWIALLILLGLVLAFGWSPPIIYTSPWAGPWNHIQIMALPVLVLTWEFSSHLLRITRSTLLDVLERSYVTAARARGLRARAVLLRHAFRNILIPILTISGLQVTTLLGGVIILESIFGLPGIGRGLVQAATVRDYPVVQSLATLLVVFALLSSLLVDLAYRLIDPRITLTSSSTMPLHTR